MFKMPGKAIQTFTDGAATHSIDPPTDAVRTKDLTCHILVKFSPEEEAFIKDAFYRSTEKSQQKFLRNIILSALAKPKNDSDI